MIIYFSKKTGEIFGTVSGRVHTQQELDNLHAIQPHGIPLEDIGRIVFSLEETRDFEELAKKNNIRLFDHKVNINNDGEFNGLAKKTPPTQDSSDVIETIVIDLTQSLEKIEEAFPKDTRSNLKNIGNLTFREIGFSERQLVLDVLEELEDLKDITLFKQILQVRAPFLDGLRRMYLVEKDNEILACAVVTNALGKVTYSLGGVTANGRTIHAGDCLIWGIIKDSKELGFTSFDLGGVYADWADDDKKKINTFKSRWGGERIPIKV